MSKVNQILPIIQMAKFYYEAGFSILPCKQNKRPAISSWAQYQENRMSESQISEYFASAVGIGLIAGKVSGGLFFIDFDDKLGNAEANLKKVTESHSYLKLLGGQKSVIVSTQSGGYHLYFRIIEKVVIPGSTKLAYEFDADGNRETSIETRGEGSYVLAPPTPGYKFIEGSYEELPELSSIQLPEAMDICRQLDAVAPANSKAVAATSTETEAEPEPEKKPRAASTSRNHTLKRLVNDKYNWMAYQLLLDAGWTKTPGGDRTKLTRPGKNPDGGCSATFGYKGNPMLHVFSDATGVFEENKSFTTFEIIANLEFEGNHKKALAHFADKCGLVQSASNFVWVGDDFFQIYSQKTPFGTVLEKMVPRKKGTIAMRHSPLIFKHIPYYINFINEPDNVDYARVVDEKFYNMARPFPHKAKEGNCKSTLDFVKHVFGEEQFELGLDYLHLLYLNPKQRLPTLVIVSDIRETGKTTFIEYLKNLMVSQSVVIDSETLDSQFNMSYGYKSLLMVDEALVRTTKVLEKLKRLATTNSLTINEKYQSRFDIPFYGKMILSGNREEDLINIDKAETRYWVLKLVKPPKNIIGLAQRLVDEIPAFLYFLQNREMKIKEADTRLWFPDALTQTAQGDVVKNASLHYAVHAIRHNLHEMFTNDEKLQEIELTPTDIKNAWFKNNNQVGQHLIVKLLKKDFSLTPGPNRKYTCRVRDNSYFDKTEGFVPIELRKIGTAYSFWRSTICDKDSQLIMLKS